MENKRHASRFFATVTAWLITVLAGGEALAAEEVPAPGAEGPAPLWRSDFSAAVAQARTAGAERPLVLLFSGAKCSWCQVLKQDSRDNQDLRAALGEVVPIEIDVTHRPDLVAMFAVQGLPTLALINRKLELVRVLRGYQPPGELATAVRVLVLHGDNEGQKPVALTAAADLAALAKDPDGVAKLAALLGVGAPESRAQVRQLLAGMPAASAALWPLLTHERLTVRVDAAAALAQTLAGPVAYDPFAAPSERAAQATAWRAQIPAHPEVVP